MKLAHLLNVRRYRRCREIFSSPLKSHVRIAAAVPRPLSLPMMRGGALRVESPRQARGLFDWILRASPDPFPVDAEDDIVVFQHEGRRIALRLLDTDFFTFAELFLRDAYGLNAMRPSLGDVVDLGANIGLFAVRVAPMAERVISVEPVEANLRLARRNVSLAALDAKITLRRYAVSPQPRDHVRLFLSQGNHGGHSISAEHAAQWGTAGYEDVPAITLAELFDREQITRCSLLKCDIEGAEFDIIDAASEELLARIDRIIMEVHLTVDRWREHQLEAVCAKLRDCGFSVVHESVHDGGERLRPVLMLSATRPQTVQAKSYSPAMDRYKTDPQSQFSSTLKPAEAKSP